MTECAGYLQHYFVAVRGSFTFKFGSIACGVICNGKKDKPRETAHKALKRLEIGFHQFVSNKGESSTSSGGVAEVSDCIVREEEEVRREQEAMRAKYRSVINCMDHALGSDDANDLEKEINKVRTCG